jgi:hypothetical protein
MKQKLALQAGGDRFRAGDAAGGSDPAKTQPLGRVFDLFRGKIGI